MHGGINLEKQILDSWGKQKCGAAGCPPPLGGNHGLQLLRGPACSCLTGLGSQDWVPGWLGYQAGRGPATGVPASWCVFSFPARSKSLVMAEQSRGAGQPVGPRRLGPVLKAGWLRKQRGIMKNWQQRWFVLRGDQLFYYKDKDETKAQVSSACPVSHGCHTVTLGLKGGYAVPWLRSHRHLSTHVLLLPPQSWPHRLLCGDTATALLFPEVDGGKPSI